MAAIIPSWAQTVGAMAEGKAHIIVDCTKCSVYKKVDTAKLVEAKGRDYSLVNRRCRCRLTGGCKGWNRFHYLHGVMRPLWVYDEVYPRWFGD